MEESAWVHVAPHADFPFWSPNGQSLYWAVAITPGSDSMILMRQTFDPQSGRPKGPPVPFQSLEGRTLGGPVVNQAIGGAGGVVLGLKKAVSDVWALDWPVR